MEQFGTITATASVLPEKIITNDDLSKMMDTSDEWISSRTGIKERHCVTEQETSDLCYLVAEKLLKKKTLDPKELDFIIVATMSPDYTSPSVATLVQGRIGATKAIAFDISAACSGFVYALSVAEKLIRCGSMKGLVIGGETLSKLIDWIEIPAAAVIADKFAKEVDFFSVGTNDLIQYTMAADRMNERVSYLYQPYNPSILRLIKNVIDAAHAEGKWAGMCGEMAGDQMAVPLLVGMGLDEFSMSATSILKTRSLMKRLDTSKMAELADRALNECDTMEEVVELVNEYLA